MPDKSWKAYERRLAKMFGTTRIPVTGEREGADFQTEMFHVSVKKRKSVPKTVLNWLGSVCAKAEERKRVGVLIMKQPGMQDLDSVVVMRLRDFLDLNVGC